MKNKEDFKQHLLNLNACEDARVWADGKTAKETWEQCDRGDWLLWWAKKENCDLMPLTLAKARCVKLVIHLMKDERSRKAVEVAEQFGLGNATRDELDAAAAAADAAAAAYAAAAYAAAYAAAADSYAAYAAAAAAAYAYAYADAAADARNEILQKCADIVRENINPTWL